MTAIVLDSGPLGLATGPSAKSPTPECAFWLRSLPSLGYRVVLPEIADYEVRRELIRARKTRGILRLEEVKLSVTYLPLTTDAMLRAAEYWAIARQQGIPTADDRDLDGDVILAAQATLFEEANEPVIVATSNPRHLSRFVDARLWTEIT